MIELSEKEINIIKHKAEGLTIREISKKIFRSPHSTNKAIHKLLRKFDLKNSSELVAWAYENGVIERITENLPLLEKKGK